MGMGVAVGRRPMSGPAGMPDPDRTVGQPIGQRRFQPVEPASGLLHRHLGVMVEHGDPRGVVAAVLQPLQSFQYPLSRLPKSDVADNSTHDPILRGDSSAGTVAGKHAGEEGRKPR